MKVLELIMELAKYGDGEVVEVAVDEFALDWVPVTTVIREDGNVRIY